MFKKGFTLVELLVVIAIIGLLSTLTVLSLNSARARARDADRIADIKQIRTALEMYYNDNSNYPQTAPLTTVNLNTNGNTYLAVIPTPQLPADGTCPTANVYTYAVGGSAGVTATYTLNYCLGASTSNLAPGMHTSTPANM